MSKPSKQQQRAGRIHCAGDLGQRKLELGAVQPICRVICVAWNHIGMTARPIVERARRSERHASLEQEAVVICHRSADVGRHNIRPLLSTTNSETTSLIHAPLLSKPPTNALRVNDYVGLKIRDVTDEVLLREIASQLTRITWLDDLTWLAARGARHPYFIESSHRVNPTSCGACLLFVRWCKTICLALLPSLFFLSPLPFVPQPRSFASKRSLRPLFILSCPSCDFCELTGQTLTQTLILRSARRAQALAPSHPALSSELAQTVKAKAHCTAAFDSSYMLNLECASSLPLPDTQILPRLDSTRSTESHLTLGMEWNRWTGRGLGRPSLLSLVCGISYYPAADTKISP
ncbi:hypothetical protein C8R45DRAFT_939632 [Mycena sanguinolenta]|nr:hypothetical protein C8R45DRAFT_939632 [Mycena sanguinolenta]